MGCYRQSVVTPEDADVLRDAQTVCPESSHQAVGNNVVKGDDGSSPGGFHFSADVKGIRVVSGLGLKKTPSSPKLSTADCTQPRR